MELAIMVEGQSGLNWLRWQRIAAAIEGLGFAGLYRSDHFTNAQAPDLDSLEMWASLTWLASHTRRIEFGQLVSPLSFRHPVFLARMGAAVDDLSGGRLNLGLGAGWQEREHAMFGFDLLDVGLRVRRFEEGVQIVHALLHNREPVSISGEFYRLEQARLLPAPLRPGGPPIVLGGNGRRRTLPLAAKYADEWNANFVPPARLGELNAELDQLLAGSGRTQRSVRRSLMTGLYFGHDDAEVKRKCGNRSPDEMRQRGLIVGTAGRVVDQLGHIARAGAQRVMLQWLDLDDLDGLEELAKSVLPQVHSARPA